jgi:hypothetical protein
MKKIGDIAEAALSSAQIPAWIRGRIFSENGDGA